MKRARAKKRRGLPASGLVIDGEVYSYAEVVVVRWLAAHVDDKLPITDERIFAETDLSHVDVLDVVVELVDAGLLVVGEDMELIITAELAASFSGKL